MLDWIFEGIVGWVASIVSQAMDAVSALFLEALGTDMTAMEEYFPFVTKAFDVIQITAWAILILITVIICLQMRMCMGNAGALSKYLSCFDTGHKLCD